MPRKQHSHHYIYKTTCKVTGRYYIGMHSTSNLEDDYIGSGKRLWNSIRKHGIENHEREILEFCSDRIALKTREAELINEELLNDKMCMNLKLGGEGGWIVNKEWAAAGGRAAQKVIWTDEFKKRISDNTRKMNNERWKDIQNKNIAKTYFTTKGHVMSKEFCESISNRNSISQKGEKNSQFGTCWVSNDLTSIRIKKEELAMYLLKGWIKGRKMKH